MSSRIGETSASNWFTLAVPTLVWGDVLAATAAPNSSLVRRVTWAIAFAVQPLGRLCAVTIPSLFSSSATSRYDFPFSMRGQTSGAKSWARTAAFSRRASLLASWQPSGIGWPLFEGGLRGIAPRALEAAFASFVRSELSLDSYSAIAART